MMRRLFTLICLHFSITTYPQAPEGLCWDLKKILLLEEVVEWAYLPENTADTIVIVDEMGVLDSCKIFELNDRPFKVVVPDSLMRDNGLMRYYYLTKMDNYKWLDLVFMCNKKDGDLYVGLFAATGNRQIGYKVTYIKGKRHYEFAGMGMY